MRESDIVLADLNNQERLDKLCELNVQTQVRHVAESPAVNEAWQNEQNLTIHGWIYSVQDGLIKDLDCTVHNLEEARSSNLLC